MFRLIAFVVALIFASAANAQVTSNLTDPVYLAVNTNDLSNGGFCNVKPTGTYCVNASNGIPLSALATNSSMNVQITSMNDRVSKAFEVATVAAAMRDAIPNPGDRFALRLNAAAMDGYAAGSVGIGVALTDSTRLSVNYGRSQTQNVVSGGLNFSFR